MKTATTVLALLALIPTTLVAQPPRFGINAAGQIPAAELAELGVGRVRFENLKWPMVSPAPGEFAFDGSVAPWHVNVDKILADYAAAGIDVLPFLFQTAAYASTAPEGTKPKQVYSYPPKDDTDYAEFVWQTVARYGSKQHPPETLKTKDKLSGLGLLKTVELWNEPNLNAPGWGPWVADMPRYFELFRAGAEAAKNADPKIKVSHGGFAGIEVDTVDQLATHRYGDGKTPLDFTDLINVHYYSGKVRPERATGDPNVNRSGHLPEGVTTYEDDLRRLVRWRNEIAPGKPIWMTETGYDTAGPHGITETEQAARLPRVVMLALAAGIESVFVYREKGSTPGQHAASGLVRDDGTKKPSWGSYKTLIGHFGKSDRSVSLDHDPNQRAIAASPDALCVWAVEASATFPVDHGPCTITEGDGKSRRIKSTKGLPLAERPIYLTHFERRQEFGGGVAGLTFAYDTRDSGFLKRIQHPVAYLFDFGGPAKRKTVDLGRHRRFIPVTKTDTFNAQRTYGFEPREAMQDGYRRWIPDFAECDDCRLSKDIAFRFEAVPGRFTVRASGTSLSDKPVAVAISQAGATIGTLSFGKDSTVSQEIKIGADGDVLVQPDGYLDLRWLTMIGSNKE